MTMIRDNAAQKLGYAALGDVQSVSADAAHRSQASLDRVSVHEVASVEMVTQGDADCALPFTDQEVEVAQRFLKEGGGGPPRTALQKKMQEGF